jgi:hypothetical protein
MNDTAKNLVMIYAYNFKIKTGSFAAGRKFNDRSYNGHQAFLALCVTTQVIPHDSRYG